MFKANLFIIGAQKAGTTSLYGYLRQHPEVQFSRVKELRFFIDSEEYSRGEAAFHSFFPKDCESTVIGSGHVHMLSSDEAPKRVHSYNPLAKLIVVLRDPVARAWSAYNYSQANGWESPEVDFGQALALESSRAESGDHRQVFDLAYAGNGLYYAHLCSWLEYFDRSQLLIVRSDDLRDDTDATMKRVYSFLELPVDDRADLTTRHNEARGSRWPWLSHLMFNKNSRLKRMLRRAVPDGARIWIRSRILPAVKRLNSAPVGRASMPEEARGLLEDFFREDLRSLESEFGIRLR